MSSQEKEQAREELRGVEGRLQVIKSSLQALYEEQGRLQLRKQALEQVLRRPVQEDKDWKASFPWDAEVRRLLEDTFKLSAFRTNQREAINAALSDRDVFVVMRTGGGKTLVYSICAFYQPGITVVVSPLISLISDQVIQLDAISPGSVTQLVGSMSREEGNAVLKAMKDPQSQQLKMVYVTPEKIAKSKLFMSTLEKLSSTGRLCRFVIDEAHCCSQWGHDFRADYAKLGVLRRLFPKVPILALTATATPEIIRDVCKILEVHSPVQLKSSWDRPNLFYEVMEKPASTDEAIAGLYSFITDTYPTGSGIVYCFSQKQAEDVAEALSSLGIASSAYHAGVEAQAKERVLRRWSSGQLQVVVATIAFGMGISKPDVRFVVHFSPSKSLESYYQESGRAGRDGQPSTCRLLYRAQDATKQAALVMYERCGLDNLRKMVGYAQGSLECRRTGIARGLGESFTGDGCGSMCDVCTGRVSAELVDMTAECTSLIKTLREAFIKKEKRATSKQLADQWLRSNKGSRLDQEQFERFVQHLLIRNVLQEDFHATAYSTNVYLLPGPLAPSVESGKMSVDFELPTEDRSSGGRPSSSAPQRKKRVPAPHSSEGEDSKPPARKRPTAQSVGSSSSAGARERQEVIEIEDSSNDDEESDQEEEGEEEEEYTF